MSMSDEIKDILYEGENLLWEGKPDKFCYMLRSFGPLLPFSLLWLLFDGFFIGVTVSTGEAGEILWFLIPFFALHLLPVWFLVGKMLKARLEYKNVVYAITDKRVIARTGVIGLDFENINYTDISNVRVDVGVLEKIRSVGSVMITTSAGTALALLSIRDPYGVYKRLNKIFMDVKSDVHFPNAYRPDENPGYHTKYKG